IETKRAEISLKSLSANTHRLFIYLVTDALNGISIVVFSSSRFAFSGLLLLLLFLTISYNAFNISKVEALSSSCECIKFEDTYHKEYGLFTSPNWPLPYEKDIDCLLYTFTAKSDQIVQMSFDSFDVQKVSSSIDDCSKGDYVKLYLDLEPGTTMIDENMLWSDILCGKSLPKWQKQHYSTGPILIIEFHTDSYNSNSTGFSGKYRFISKKSFEPDGELLSGTHCDYQFLSITMSGRRSGKFFSPNFPSNYPKNIHCAYHFMGKYNEKVKILFEKIDLGNEDMSCLDTTDSIHIYDGRDAQGSLIAQLCNNNKYVDIVSTGPDLHITFVSGVGESSSSSQGFNAFYEFAEIQQLNGFNNSLNSLFSNETRVIKSDPEEGRLKDETLNALGFQ
ncbi:cubilin-like protein, partial [Dinothrombium tinctorium]